MRIDILIPLFAGVILLWVICGLLVSPIIFIFPSTEPYFEYAIFAVFIPATIYVVCKIDEAEKQLKREKDEQ